MIGQSARGRNAPYIFLSPFLLIFAVFLVYPLLSSVSLSMHRTFGPRSSRFVVNSPQTDLLAPLPHAKKEHHTVAREAMLLADHTAYHLGQLIVVRRALGAWED